MFHYQNFDDMVTYYYVQRKGIKGDGHYILREERNFTLIILKKLAPHIKFMKSMCNG